MVVARGPWAYMALTNSYAPKRFEPHFSTSQIFGLLIFAALEFFDSFFTLCLGVG